MPIAIKIFVDDGEHVLNDALEMLSDDEIDNGIYCAQTVIDLRDAVKYLKGRSDVMERLYKYTIHPPASFDQVDEFIRLREWFDDEA